jgi:hypothetical protein
MVAEPRYLAGNRAEPPRLPVGQRIVVATNPTIKSHVPANVIANTG